MPILKRSPGFEPTKLFQSDAQLLEAAIHAYSLLSSTLTKNGAPDTIPADAFTEQLPETKKAYTAMISHAQNYRLVLNMNTNAKEEDPLYWGYTILVQWYHVRAKMDNTTKLTPKESIKREREEEGEAVERIHKLTFNEHEFRRHFHKDEWVLQEEERQLTRSFDGPSSVAITLEKLFVSKVSSTPGIKPVAASLSEAHRLISADPKTTQLGTVVQELQIIIERIKRRERPILYKSNVKLSFINLPMVEKITETLSRGI